MASVLCSFVNIGEFTDLTSVPRLPLQSWNMHVANQAPKDVTHIRQPDKFANGKCSREGYVLYLLLLWGFGASLQARDAALWSIYGLNPALPDKTQREEVVFRHSNNKSIHSECRKYRKACFTIIKCVSNLLGHKAFLQVFATLFLYTLEYQSWLLLPHYTTLF